MTSLTGTRQALVWHVNALQQSDDGIFIRRQSVPPVYLIITQTFSELYTFVYKGIKYVKHRFL